MQVCLFQSVKIPFITSDNFILMMTLMYSSITITMKDEIY